MTVLTVSGSLSMRERIAVPPGSVATVKVVDSEGEVLAATAVTVDQVPVDFSVSIDREFVTHELFVWALLRTEDGGWGTLELVPAQQSEIMLTRIEA